MQYVHVTDVENSEAIEIPTDDDGTLTVAALAAHYPGATGLKYRLDGHVRAVKLANDRLSPPEGGWGDTIYYCIFPKDATKRKASSEPMDTSETKQAKVDDSKWVHTDLVVLGLPWKTDDKSLREYFSKYGDLQLAQVKLDPVTKKSKGYGFIRFTEQEVQVRVMLQRHQIDGRWCDVRIPVSKDTIGKKSPYKVFVGQCTEDLTEDVLRTYFTQYGEISDLYVPKPFRGFAFVTFVDSNAARGVCAEEHQIKDTKVYVTEAVPKGDSDKFGGGGGRGPNKGGFKRRGGGDDYYDNRRNDYYGGRGGDGGSGGRREAWGRDDRWSSYKEPNAWQTKDWSRPSNSAPPRWRESAPEPEPAFNRDLMASVVNKAVMGVIGNLKGPEANGGYGKDDWWSRR